MKFKYSEYYVLFSTIKWILFFSLSVIIVGCASNGNFSIKEHRFKITDLRESTAQEIISKIESSQYNAYIEDKSFKTKVVGEEVSDYTFVISDPNYTNNDIAYIVNRILGQNRRDPVVLRSTTVIQEYSSASGAGTAQVRLRIDITKNANAYYKSTGYPVEVKWDDSGKSAWFLYDRQEKEEYVDIYILPTETPTDSKPNKFQRISLHAPYSAQILDWERSWFTEWLENW